MFVAVVIAGLAVGVVEEGATCWPAPEGPGLLSLVEELLDIYKERRSAHFLAQGCSEFWPRPWIALVFRARTFLVICGNERKTSGRMLLGIEVLCAAQDSTGCLMEEVGFRTAVVETIIEKAR